MCTSVRLNCPIRYVILVTDFQLGQHSPPSAVEVDSGIKAPAGPVKCNNSVTNRSGLQVRIVNFVMKRLIQPTKFTKVN